MRPDRLLLATGNAHKLREVGEILAPFGVTIDPPAAVGGLPEVSRTPTLLPGTPSRHGGVTPRVAGVWRMIPGSKPELLQGVQGVFSPFCRRALR